MSFWKSTTVRIVAAMVAGAVLGGVWGTRAAVLSDISRLIVQLVKIFATPLLFLSVLTAVLNKDLGGRRALRMLGIALLNAGIALGIGLAFSNVFKVGESLRPLFVSAAVKAKPEYSVKIELGNVLANFVPDSVLQPFVNNLALSLILLAVLIGCAVRRLARDGESVDSAEVLAQGAGWWLRITETILFWVVQLIPIGVFCAVAAGVGKAGLEVFTGLFACVVLALGALVTHVLVTHHAWLIHLRRSIPEFWREAREPVVYALGTNSSLATLPITLKALRRLGVSDEAATLGACVGTNFNNDGIILYEGLAALLVAQAMGIHLDLWHQIAIGLLSAVAAMGVAGVPEAGFISLALVLSTLGLPTEALPLLLTVDWIVARGRSAVNVCSDMIVSMAIDGRVAAPSVNLDRGAA